MTDAKQALEVVERLRQYPDLPRIPVAGQALMSEAASLLSSLAEENERLLAWLSVLEPHLDAVICYASDMDEHPPNRVVAEVRAYIAPTQDTTHD